MRISILTQPLHINYGGTLQAYALQVVLKKMGHEVETINYVWKDSSDFKKILSFYKKKFLNRSPKYFFFNKELQYISRYHASFISKSINLSKKIENSVLLSKYFEEKKFDVVIVGSDQVWRRDYSPKIENFFLDFLENNNQIKKIAYAASFGLELWQFSKNEDILIKNLMKKFNYISVREDSAVDLCKKFLNLDVGHVLDPTLLLTKNDYMKFVNSDVECGGVFSYILDNNEVIMQKVEGVCKILNKKNFICMPKSHYKHKLLVDDLEDFVYPKIEEWITSFYKADYVITDSFHGTVFSIIFNKPFISLCNNERGAARFKSVLKIFNLEDRLIDTQQLIDMSIIAKPIDYDLINIQLDKLRSISINNLGDALKL